MKKKFLTLLALTPAIMCLSSCRSNINVKELQPYLFLTDVYNELDYKFADKYYTEHYDNWEGGGCSAVSKEVNGTRLVGRNMDLNISNKAAYIVPTNTGLYKTIGLAYTFRDFNPDYLDVKENGLSKEFGKLLPFICDDVLNEKGLHIEINMRHAEFWPNGDDMFACEHTNKFSDQRIHMFQIPRLVGEKCATVTEALQYLSTLDVYSQNRYWNYCFIISDPTQAVLVEFCLNKMIVLTESEIPEYNEFLDAIGDPTVDFRIHAIAQTNFYVNYEAYLMENTKSGLGRFKTLQENIDSVQDKNDMFKLMDKISYSWFYSEYDTCKNEHFDPRSEQIGEAPYLTYEILMNPNLEPYIKKLQNDYTAPIRELTREQKRAENKYWESTFTEVVDCSNKTIMIRFYEDYDYMYNISFDDTAVLKAEHFEYNLN